MPDHYWKTDGKLMANSSVCAPHATIQSATPAFPSAGHGRPRGLAVRLVRRLVVVCACAASACAGPTAPTPGPSGPGPGPAGPTIPDFVNCSVFPDNRSSAYVLPFAVGQRFKANRTFGHYTSANDGVGLYAIDFPMPVGTPVHAARGGIVVAVEERFTDNDHGELHENWVMIRHGDDTVARYLHLTHDGALVEVGDIVVQGQVVGLAGNSGPSSQPHLHFDVQTCGPNLPPAYNRLPCGMTVPVSFRNADAHACGLQEGASYTALAFTPELR